MQDSLDSKGDSTGSVLFDFADQLLSDLDAGRAYPLAHYLARFPGHEERVAREYFALVGDGAAAADDSTVETVPTVRPERIGPYRLAQVLGRGGQGVVYRAEDARLQRTVALKVLELSVASSSRNRLDRFRREAEIVSRLDHPGICTVLDADLDCATPYIAMRFVEGETLAMALTRARERRAQGHTPTPDTDTVTSASRLLAPRRALELAETLSFFERVARALHAAHEAGVVHRDVKPGNIMVSKEGAPVILDFGLARDEGEESAVLTRPGEVFGTPAYVSPEQLKSGRDVDRRTDVYSLGVVLYECLTLVRPFRGDSSAALAQAIQFAPPPPLRASAPGLPQDLAVVLETALEKDVGRRYASALELAEELRRVREYEPIRARPAGHVLRLRRWAQRNPVVATGTIGSIVALSVALVVALVLLGRVNDEKQRKEAALALYEGGWYRDQAASSLPYYPPRSLHFAIAAAERDPGLASNRVLLAALDSLYQKQMLVGHTAIVMHLDVDPASQRVVTGSLDGTARVWDAHGGRELAAFSMPGGSVLCARFAPDGARIVAAGQAGELCIWNTAEPGAAPLRLEGHAGDVHWAEFSPDGTRVVSASRDHTARVWDARDGRELARLAGHTGSLAEARFLAGGRFVLTRSAEPPVSATAEESDFTARLFDAASGAELAVFRGHTAAITCMAVSPDLRALVTTSADRTARVWRVALDVPGAWAEDPAPERVFEAPGKFHGAAFGPDGRHLALVWDAGGKVVEVESGALVYALPNHEHRAVARVAFSPDGRELATIAYDGALRVFRASDGALLRLCRGDTRQLSGFVWSPDGSFLATWQRLPAVDLWYGAERPFLQVLGGHGGEVRTARFDGGGERILTASADGTARIWNARTAQLERVLDPRAAGHPGTPLVGAGFDPAGERITTTDESGTVRLWNARDGTLLASYAGGRPTSLAASFSPDGTRIVMAEQAGCALLIELSNGRRLRLRAHAGEIGCWRFSSDGARIATGGEDRTVCLWEVGGFGATPHESESAVPLWRSAPFDSEFYHLKNVFDVVFSPDGRWVVAACQNLSIGLYDARDGSLRGAGGGATPGRVCFSGDGRLLMVTSKYSNFATLWRIDEEARGEPVVREALPTGPGLHHTSSMTAIAAAARAPLVVTGSLDRSVRLWDLARRECTASYVGHTDRVLDVDISPDGRLVVSASSDGTARLWPGDLLATARLHEPPGFAQSFGPLPVPETRD